MNAEEGGEADEGADEKPMAILNRSRRPSRPGVTSGVEQGRQEVPDTSRR